MFQLRGLGEDCAANPTDPVCRAFYGTPTALDLMRNQIKTQGFVQFNQPMPNVPAPSSSISTTAATPGTIVTTFASSKPWYMTWWGLGLLAAGGYAAWKYSRPRKPASVTAPATVPAGGTAGLFGIPMNENGLSYYRWIKAAGVKGGGNASHYAAWKRGEDPTDWRVGR